MTLTDAQLGENTEFVTTWCGLCEQRLSLAAEMEFELGRVYSQIVEVLRCLGCHRALWYRSKASMVHGLSRPLTERGALLAYIEKH